MEDSLTIFIMGVGLLGLYQGCLIGKNVDKKFSKHKWISKFMNGLFVATFTFLLLINIQTFASSEDNKFEFSIPTSWESAVDSLLEQVLLSKGGIGFLHLCAFAITLPFILSIRGKDAKFLKNVGMISPCLLILVTFTPYVPSETTLILYTTFQFSAIVGVFIGIDKSSRHSLKELVRFMLGKYAISK